MVLMGGVCKCSRYELSSVLLCDVEMAGRVSHVFIRARASSGLFVLVSACACGTE
jgi:hypothetical protein